MPRVSDPKTCNHTLPSGPFGERHSFEWDLDDVGRQRNIFNPFAPECSKCGTSIGAVVRESTTLRAELSRLQAQCAAMRNALFRCRASGDINALGLVDVLSSDAGAAILRIVEAARQVALLTKIFDEHVVSPEYIELRAAVDELEGKP